jgi:hypothetical protein
LGLLMGHGIYFLELINQEIESKVSFFFLFIFDFFGLFDTFKIILLDLKGRDTLFNLLGSHE